MWPPRCAGVLAQRAKPAPGAPCCCLLGRDEDATGRGVRYVALSSWCLTHPTPPEDCCAKALIFLLGGAFFYLLNWVHFAAFFVVLNYCT